MDSHLAPEVRDRFEVPNNDASDHAVVHELPPTGPRDVIGRTIRVETGDALAPIAWNWNATFWRW